MLTTPVIIILAVLFVLLIVIPTIIQMFLRNVEAGTIRIVTLWGGHTHIYRGPGKSFEVPLFTNGTTLSSKAINVDLDITDQTADLDRDGLSDLYISNDFGWTAGTCCWGWAPSSAWATPTC